MLNHFRKSKAVSLHMGECVSSRRYSTWHLLAECESQLRLAAIQERIVLLNKRVKSHTKHCMLHMAGEESDVPWCNLIYTLDFRKKIKVTVPKIQLSLST